MGKRKVVRSNGAILKSKGFIPKKWDLRKKLTDYKKRVISQLSKDYPELIKHPDRFTSRKYKPETAQKLYDAGYSMHKNRVLLPNRINKSGKGSPTLSTKVKDNKLIIDRGNRIETVYLNSGPDFLKMIERRMDEVLPYDEYWALKVGDNNTFLKNHTQTINALTRYGETLNFSDPSARNFVHLVHVKFKPGQIPKQLPYDYNNPTEVKPKWRRNKRRK